MRETRETHETDAAVSIRAGDDVRERMAPDSQHTEALQAFEHAAAHRVQLVGSQVQLDDRRGPFKSSVLDLGDLVVTEVSVAHSRDSHQHQRQTTYSGLPELAIICFDVSGLHFLELRESLEHTSGLQCGDLIIVEAPVAGERNKQGQVGGEGEREIERERERKREREREKDALTEEETQQVSLSISRGERNTNL